MARTEADVDFPKHDGLHEHQRAMGTTGHRDTGLTGSPGAHTAGPHASNLANKADPGVDSDLDGRSGLGGTTTGLGLTGSTTGTGMTGPETGAGTTGPGLGRTSGISGERGVDSGVGGAPGADRRHEAGLPGTGLAGTGADTGLTGAGHDSTRSGLSDPADRHPPSLASKAGPR